jgi:hypothetical protein
MQQRITTFPAFDGRAEEAVGFDTFEKAAVS